MHIVDDSIETVHLYVVREEPKRPYTLLPLLAAFMCLVAIASLTTYSGQHPAYEHQTLTVPAQLLPPQTFTASAPIIPTGIKNYPATTAHGSLTFSNGSVIGLSVPQGFTVEAANGVPVVTDASIYVPAATVDSFGEVTVSARLGRDSVNLPAYSVNLVIGSSLFVRNLSPFTGGRPAYSVKFITSQDKRVALMKARQVVASLVVGYHYPCIEQVSGALTVTWRCQFVTFRLPTYMHIITARLSGKNFLVDVVFVAPPMLVRMK